jgi:hypothetical protein
MFGQELFGQLLFLSFFIYIWTTYAAVRIVTFINSNSRKRDNLLFYQALTLIPTAGITAILFKAYGIGLLLPFLAFSSITTGVYFYLAIQKRNAAWWKKLNAYAFAGSKVLVATLTVVITGAVFALVVLSCFRVM